MGDFMSGIIIFIAIVVMGSILVRIKEENKFTRFGKLALVVLVVVFFCFWGEGMVSGGKIHITEKKMKVEYLKADREYTGRMKLSANRRLSIQSKCSQEGMDG